jgi:hypothetical protein
LLGFPSETSDLVAGEIGHVVCFAISCFALDLKELEDLCGTMEPKGKTTNLYPNLQNIFEE